MSESDLLEEARARDELGGAGKLKFAFVSNLAINTSIVPAETNRTGTSIIIELEISNERVRRSSALSSVPKQQKPPAAPAPPEDLKFRSMPSHAANPPKHRCSGPCICSPENGESDTYCDTCADEMVSSHR
jgi:hypothetical protein